MIEYVIKVDENDERWHYVAQQYTHFFGYPITEQIVRCRNCREYHPELYKHISCELLGRNVEPNGFCSWGVWAVCQNEHGHCSVCGAIMYDAPNYCPNCGAKVQAND